MEKELLTAQLDKVGVVDKYEESINRQKKDREEVHQKIVNLSHKTDKPNIDANYMSKTDVDSVKKRNKRRKR